MVAAVCNGDATSLESFKGQRMKAFNGMCVVYLRSKAGQAGKSVLKAMAEGVPVATLELGCR